MRFRGLHRVLLLGLVPILCHPVYAQMCKWVDEDGCVHYAEQCPEGVEGQTVELQPEPSEEQATAAAESYERARQDLEARKAEQRPPPSVSGSAAGPQRNPVTLSPEDVECPRARLSAYVRKMEAACEQARERHIAPLRQEAIDQCVNEEKKDRSWCEHHYADYLNPTYVGRLSDPRPYDFLPECVIARKCAEEAGMEPTETRRGR